MLLHPEWNDWVHRQWDSNLEVINNLNNLKKAVAIWNKETFGNIFYNKRKILTRLEGIQAARESKDSNYLKRLEEKLLDDFNSILIKEELY